MGKIGDEGFSRAQAVGFEAFRSVDRGEREDDVRAIADQRAGHIGGPAGGGRRDRDLALAGEATQSKSEKRVE